MKFTKIFNLENFRLYGNIQELAVVMKGSRDEEEVPESIFNYICITCKYIMWRTCILFHCHSLHCFPQLLVQ